MTTVEGDRRLLGGRYELQERIATGGMGEVWRGRDVVLQRDVAVKVLRSCYADDPTFVERFRGEARHAAALNHPNIAAVLDYGEASQAEAGEHLAYLVMELVEGEPLSARLASGGPMQPEDALSVLGQAAAGLAEAHRRGVVHRDVKPANILVRPDGAVKLTDFGIARSADSVPLTGTGQVVGTAQYMSPEQAKGEPATPASDVYALGLVGYESLTGHAAFHGTNPVTVALQHVVADPEPLPAELPDQVRGLIDSALVKDPGQRIQDGAAFLTAVQATRRPVPGDPVSDTRPARAVVSAGASRVAAPEPRGRRHLLAVLLPLFVLCVAAAGTLAFVLAAPGSGDPGSGDPGGSGGQAGSGGGSPERPSVAADPGVVLAAADSVGRPYAEVASELGALGLVVVRIDEVDADSPAGTVTAIDPAGVRLDEGDEVRVTVAADPPEAPLPETTSGSGGGGSSVPADDGAASDGGAAAGDGAAAGGPATVQDEPAAAPAPAEPQPGTAPTEAGADPAATEDPGTPSDPPAADPGTPSAPAPDAGTPTSPAPAGPTGTTTEPPATGPTAGTAAAQPSAAG